MKIRLFLVSALSALGLLIAFGGYGDDSCDDEIPDNCSVVEFVGEEDGCACFKCNPDSDKPETVCTNDNEDKKTLFALVEEEEPPRKSEENDDGSAKLK